MKLFRKFNYSFKVNTLKNIKIESKTVHGAEFYSASIVASVLALPSEPIHRIQIV